MFYSLGSFLLCLCLYYYSLLFLAQQIQSFIDSKNIDNNSSLLPIFNFLVILQSTKVRTNSGYIAFLIALWNFFAPDFGSISGGITIIGALLPSIILFINAFILAPHISDFLPFDFSHKEKLNNITNRINPITGWVTLIIALLHSFFAPLPFL